MMVKDRQSVRLKSVDLFKHKPGIFFSPSGVEVSVDWLMGSMELQHRIVEIERGFDHAFQEILEKACDPELGGGRFIILLSENDLGELSLLRDVEGGDFSTMHGDGYDSVPGLPQLMNSDVNWFAAWFNTANQGDLLMQDPDAGESLFNMIIGGIQVARISGKDGDGDGYAWGHTVFCIDVLSSTAGRETFLMLPSTLNP
jgi:hypothetical protein